MLAGDILKALDEGRKVHVNSEYFGERYEVEDARINGHGTEVYAGSCGWILLNDRTDIEFD